MIHPDRNVYSMVFLQDKKLFVAVSSKQMRGTCCIWEVGSGFCIYKISAAEYHGMAPVFSPNSRLLACLSNTYDLEDELSLSDTSSWNVWDSETCALKCTVEATWWPGNSLDFSSDRSLLASVSLDGWSEVRNVKQLLSSAASMADSAVVRSTQFFQTGLRLACIMFDRTLDI